MTTHDEGGQVTVHGKGGKTRHILLPPICREILTLRGEAGPAAPVFRSQRGGHLHLSQVLRIGEAAARRAGLSGAESPRWLRHAHASHALDRGAPIHVVQATLGHSSVATAAAILMLGPPIAARDTLRCRGGLMGYARSLSSSGYAIFL